MAEHKTSGNDASQESTRQSEAETARLAGLRNLAQQHLDEIDVIERSDRDREQKRVADLQREKQRREGAGQTQLQMGIAADDGGEGEREGRKAKMRTAQDVLDRIRWDPLFHVDQYYVGYSDRFGGMQELPVSEWIKESTDEEWIPQHRIRYFRKSGNLAGEKEGIVWDRDSRIDKVFGST